MTDDGRGAKYCNLIGQAEYIFAQCRPLLIGASANSAERRVQVLSLIKDWEAQVKALFPRTRAE